MRRQVSHGLVTYQFEHPAFAGIEHAVFTRLGGVSRGPLASLNVGRSVGDDPAAVDENLRRVYAHLGLAAGQVVTPWQVHGNRVVAVSGHDGGQVVPNADGLVTATPGLALLLRFADCQPILLYDPEHHALGLVHAGWRGVAQGTAIRAVEAMQASFGTRPGALVAGLGPAIGPCCYVVGDEVAAAMGYALPDWRRVMQPLPASEAESNAQADGSEGGTAWRFDLPAANAQQLTAAGVANIEQADLCTATHSDEFYSHRASNGQTGRFAVVAFLGLRPAGLHEARAEAQPAEAGRQAAPGALDSLAPPGFPSFQEMLEEEER
ncbi:MAG TPA: peptidoglycan editing factor PgeF [Anaerolineae bacterium]|nr:peptidoglycan editing factor PgeF [Anaerolineae bacterium]